MKHDSLSLHFSQVLARELEKSTRKVSAVGTDSPLALALTLTQPEWAALHNLVIVPSDTEAQALASEILFLDPHITCHILPEFDVSPYSGLYPNHTAISQRIRWLIEAQQARTQTVLIAPIGALQQKTLPSDILLENTHVWRKGTNLPDPLTRYLLDLGYQQAPLVEDVGTFSVRGGIVDIFSPAHDGPVRLELFGDTIESLRLFNPETQRSEAELTEFTLTLPREVLFSDASRERAAQLYREETAARKCNETDRDIILQGLVLGTHFPGLDFLLGLFYDISTTPLDHTSPAALCWHLSPIDIARQSDIQQQSLRAEFERCRQDEYALCPEPHLLYEPLESLDWARFDKSVELQKIQIHDPQNTEDTPEPLPLRTNELNVPSEPDGVAVHVRTWRQSEQTVFIAAGTLAQSQRLKTLLEKHELEPLIVDEQSHLWPTWQQEQREKVTRVHIVPRHLSAALRWPDENLVFLRDEDFFGQKKRRRDYKTSGSLAERTHVLSFADLQPGNRIVHVLHGIGIYEGLKVMSIQGIDAEFIQLSYKDGDKLYVPTYRVGQIQKYDGPSGQNWLDKLGGNQWQKTKLRVRNHLRELAADLLALYAKRSQAHRAPFAVDEEDFLKFEAAFPYDETNDQLRAVQDIVGDLRGDRPMDRLVCGDVGFGKTEVAMRAAFQAVQARMQVVVLAPTTVLTFQHLETFQKRFRGWPVEVRALNRFVPTAQARQTVQDLKEGKVDIIIGTHRLLSKDVQFKNLGLLIIDEEQKFGVTHKEKIRKMKTLVDTLTLSATPIPRTLNMSLMGMRDLSIINTPPVDRLPTRTFICRFDTETIRKAITSELQRGGQVFFIHNRVQSIYGVADQLREIVPQARLRIGHGQMDEKELESTVVAFFNHEVDVLVCTTIIESGIDNPRANTMFIDDAHTFGLSQLYQLRGRVGRSKERAYCYLLIPGNRRLDPVAQERLKVIQENTALGSGIKIAHHDLELRGAGNILGEDQSGEIDAVGYELYLELLDEALREAKGEPATESLEPEINIRIPALIPDAYMPDIRIRLSYYKILADIRSPEDMDQIEGQLRDQFGPLPEPVLNLMGLMLIRAQCRQLGIRDISSGPKTLSLAFTEHTPLPPTKVVQLASLENKKYSITPDNRLIIRMNEIAWPKIYDELQYLEKLCR